MPKPTMQCIVTRYHGATNTRGSRISAVATCGKRCSIPYPHEANTEEAHAMAALKLARSLQLEGALTAGSLPRGFVFVFTDSPTWTI